MHALLIQLAAAAALIVLMGVVHAPASPPSRTGSGWIASGPRLGACIRAPSRS